MADFSEVPEGEKTPVTIVTGFLGAGKTTLVNYILKEQNTWKICIVENEFGEVSIDDDLVGSNMKSTEDIITMDNGCVCCTVRGDLVRTFGELISRRKQFDCIIIETTGLADPAPILYTFNSNTLLQDNYRIDSIVCMVDSKHVGHHLDEVKPDGSLNEAEHQIAFSDRIILNKLDLVSADELKEVEDRIRSINSFAALIRTTNSRAPLDQVLGLNSFSLERLVDLDPTLMEEEEEAPEHEHSHDHGSCSDHACSHEAPADHDHDHGHGHGHDHDHASDHGHGKEKGVQGARKKVHNLSLVSSVGFTIDGLLDVTKFNDFMSAFLKEKAIDLYRSKGVLGFSDQGDVKFVFQGVHDQIQFGPSEHSWLPGEPRKSKLVFIGKGLDYDFLKENIQQCTSDPATSHVTMHKRS